VETRRRNHACLPGLCAIGARAFARLVRKPVTCAHLPELVLNRKRSVLGLSRSIRSAIKEMFVSMAAPRSSRTVQEKPACDGVGCLMRATTAAVAKPAPETLLLCLTWKI
jgi:hypothetical protein